MIGKFGVEGSWITNLFQQKKSMVVYKITIK